MENHHAFNGENPLYMAIFNSKLLVYQRVATRSHGSTIIPSTPDSGALGPVGNSTAGQNSTEISTIWCQISTMGSRTGVLPSGKRLQFAIENGPFIVDLPIKNCDFPIVMLVYQRLSCCTVVKPSVDLVNEANLKAETLEARAISADVGLSSFQLLLILALKR
jgi:hypothetical protein